MESFLIRRISRDLRELSNDPIPGVVVACDEKDASKLAVEMTPCEGPYAGIPVHMHLAFPGEYPKKPPKVDLMTPIVHPNVYEWGICLDMLHEYEYAGKPYTGWSSAYDIPGVLRQLYGFLLCDESIDQDYGDSVKRAEYKVLPHDIQRAREFKCNHCSPGPPECQIKNTVNDNDTIKSNGSVDLPLDIIHKVLMAAGSETVVVSSAADLADMASEIQRKEEQRCFYTKEQPDNDTVLGLGVNVRHHADGNVQSISTTMDLVSGFAFHTHGVRKSAWNFPVNAFLPLVLNAEHGKKALRMLPDMLPSMAPRGRSTSILNVIAQIMNSLVVSLVQEGKQTPSHMSDAALGVFCHLHHLLLTVATSDTKGDAIIRESMDDVKDFISSPHKRNKRYCPDLGVLLVKLLLVPSDIVPWSTFAPVFIRELLARQVLWLSRKFGDVFVRPWDMQGGPDADKRRLSATFECAITGLRVVALQAWFANALARPAKDTSKLVQIRDTYHARNGSCPQEVFVRFNKHAHRVMSMNKWTDYLSVLRLGLRNDASGPAALFASMLRQAILDSSRAGYHKQPTGTRNAPSQFNYELWEPNNMPVIVVDDAW